jgi:c-di-GMP-binding flagellar brake protein YcgR
MSEPKGRDRRKFERIERKDEIQIKEFTYPERGRYQRARIKDLSSGGLQIEARQYFPPKTLLKIEMNFTGWQRYTPGFLKYFGDASSRPLIVLAEVVRCDSVVPGERYDVAVEFSGIDESHREALRRFIQKEITSKD